MSPIELIVGFILGILGNFATTAIQPPIPNPFQKRLEEAQRNEEALRNALASKRSLRDEVHEACKQLSLNRHLLGISPVENQLWLLLTDARFQDDLTEWIIAGDMQEGKAVTERLSQAMESALKRSGASIAQIDAFKTEYFESINRAIFSNDILARWRHQLSIDYLREQVAAARIAAERAAGIYSDETQAAALESYLAKRLQIWDIVDLSNLPEGDIHMATQQLLLRQLYMPLRLNVENSTDHDNNDTVLDRLEKEREAKRLWEAGRISSDELETKRPKERVSVGERLSAAQRLVVLGDPGGGKTTMMCWLATAYVLRDQDKQAFAQLPDTENLPQRTWIPVLIRCRDIGAADLCRSFQDFLIQHLNKSELQHEEAKIMLAVILDRIAKGDVLLLIDGLDEITDPQVRVLFCQELERTAARYPDAHIIVTSRIVGYRDMPYRMGKDFEHSLIADLDQADKAHFAQRWIEVTQFKQPPAEKKRLTDELIEALASSDRIQRLTGNPMLLTTLSLVKRKVGKLPSRRHKLYEEAVKVLLNWNPLYATIDEEEAIPQLGCLAYEMCRQGIQRLTENEMLDLLDKFRTQYPNIQALKAGRGRSPYEFLKLLEQRSSILIQSGGQWKKISQERSAFGNFAISLFRNTLLPRRCVTSATWIATKENTGKTGGATCRFTQREP